MKTISLCKLYSSIVLALLPCSCETASGNLYFVSTQRLGLNIALSEPTNNSAPDVAIGYKSVKGAVVPVKGPGGVLVNQAYSVLGITEASGGAEGEGNIAGSEWFATGLAAEILARNPATPAALNGWTALTPELLKDATQLEAAKTFVALMAAENWLAGLPEKSLRQQAMLDALNTLATPLEFVTFPGYDANTGKQAPPALTGNGWGRVTSTLSALENASNAATRWAESQVAGSIEQANGKRDAMELSQLYDRLVRDILSRRAALDVWNEFFSLLVRGGSND